MYPVRNIQRDVKEEKGPKETNQRINKKTFTELGTLTLKDWKRGRGEKKKRKKKIRKEWKPLGLGLPRFLTQQDINFGHELFDKFWHSMESTSRSYARGCLARSQHVDGFRMQFFRNWFRVSARLLRFRMNCLCCLEGRLGSPTSSLVRRKLPPTKLSCSLPPR